MTALFAILMAHFGVYVYHNAGFVVILIGLISSLIWFLSLKPANSIIRFLSLMTVAMLTGASVASVFEYFRFADIDLLLRLCTGAFAPVIFLLLMSFLVTINNEWLFLIAVVASGFSLVVWSHLRPGLGFSYLNFRLLLGCQIFGLFLWQHMKAIIWISSNGEMDIDCLRHGLYSFSAFTVFFIMMLFVCRVD